jgi:hypothetical protein
MKTLRAADVRRAVDAAGRAITAALDMRHKPIVSDMLNSAGSVSAEWYIETLWHYLAKRALLAGVSSFDVEFRQPARLADKQIHFSLPHPEADDLVMDFHVMRVPPGAKKSEKVPVARIAIHRGTRRRRHGVAPEPPAHPYGIEVRTRHLNAARQVSWVHPRRRHHGRGPARRAVRRRPHRSRRRHTALHRAALHLHAARRRGAARQPLRLSRVCDGAALGEGRTSATARVTFWAVANAAPWPIAESVVTVVRTSVVDGARRPVDENGDVVSKGGK